LLISTESILYTIEVNFNSFRNRGAIWWWNWGQSDIWIDWSI